MKRNIFIIVMLILWGCGIGTYAQKTGERKSTVEVVYFYGKQRCITCRAIEKYAKEAVAEMRNGRVKFKVVDISTDDGARLAKKYKVAFSSLFVVKGGNSVNLTQFAFRNARSNTAEFKRGLKENITEQLKQ